MYAIRYDWKNCAGSRNQPDERHRRADARRRSAAAAGARQARGSATSAVCGQRHHALEPVPLGGRHVGERRVLAELQRADVGDDRPAILGLDLRRVVGHRAEPVGDHVEEVPDRRLAQPVVGAATAAGGSRAARPCRRRRRCGRGTASRRCRSAPGRAPSRARRPGTETPSRPRRSPCRCRAARRRAAGRGRPCRRPAAAPTARRRRTSTRRSGMYFG